MDIDKIAGFLPPMPPALRWRVVVTIVMMIAMFHVAWSMGFVPGLDGFAQTNQIAAIKQQMDVNSQTYKAGIDDVKRTQNAIIVRLIASDAENARTQQCKALKEKRPDAADGWRARLYASLQEYQSAAGYPYPLRDCTEY